MLMMELIILITCAIMLIIATGYDLKWRYVPDYASYSFIAIAIILRILYAQEQNDYTLLLWTLPATAILFGIGYLMYKSGLWGGGDVKIITSVAILLAKFPNETIPMFSDFFLNLLIMGAVYSYPATMIIARKIKKTKTEKALIITGLIIMIATITLNNGLMSTLIGFSILIGLSLPFLKRIEKELFIKEANMKTLMDGDWLVNEVRVGKKVIKPKKEGLSVKEAEQIKKWWSNGQLKKKPLIKEGIAYLPAFLITYIITILSGNLLLAILTEGMTNQGLILTLIQ